MSEREEDSLFIRKIGVNISWTQKERSITSEKFTAKQGNQLELI
jgi:hypothetical protein